MLLAMDILTPNSITHRLKRVTNTWTWAFNILFCRSAVIFYYLRQFLKRGGQMYSRIGWYGMWWGK